MAKILVIPFIIFLLGALALPAGAARAQSAGVGQDALNFLDDTAQRSGLGATESGEDSTLKIIGNIINILLGFVGVLFFIQLFWAGIRWMTSQGNEEVVKAARGTIKTAVIGIVVVFSAFIITNFALNQIEKITGAQPAETPQAAQS